MSDRLPSDFTKPSDDTVVVECRYAILVSGSNEPPSQLDPPAAVAGSSVASGPGQVLTTGGVKIGPSL